MNVCFCCCVECQVALCLDPFCFISPCSLSATWNSLGKPFLAPEPPGLNRWTWIVCIPGLLSVCLGLSWCVSPVCCVISTILDLFHAHQGRVQRHTCGCRPTRPPMEVSVSILRATPFLAPISSIALPFVGRTGEHSPTRHAPGGELAITNRVQLRGEGQLRVGYVRADVHRCRHEHNTCERDWRTPHATPWDCACPDRKRTPRPPGPKRRGRHVGKPSPSVSPRISTPSTSWAKNWDVDNSAPPTCARR